MRYPFKLRLDPLDVAAASAAIGGGLLLICIASSQPTWNLLVRVSLVTLAVGLIALLVVFWIVDLTNGTRLAVLEDRIAWKSGVLHHLSAYEEMRLASVRAVLARAGSRAFRIVALEEGRVRALWIRPVRKQRENLRTLLRSRIGDAVWCESEAVFSERVKRMYEDLRRKARNGEKA